MCDGRSSSFFFCYFRRFFHCFYSALRFFFLIFVLKQSLLSRAKEQKFEQTNDKERNSWPDESLLLEAIVLTQSKAKGMKKHFAAFSVAEIGPRERHVRCAPLPSRHRSLCRSSTDVFDYPFPFFFAHRRGPDDLRFGSHILFYSFFSLALANLHFLSLRTDADVSRSSTYTHYFTSKRTRSSCYFYYAFLLCFQFGFSFSSALAD